MSTLQEKIKELLEDGDAKQYDEWDDPRIKSIGYSCPVCGEVYETKREAEKCRDQPIDRHPEVGDLMVVPGARHRSTLEDGSPWIAFKIPPDPDSSSHFDRAGYTVPYFVVTAVHGEDRNPHRTVVTLAQVCSKGFIRIGWNPSNGRGHLAMFRVSDGERYDGGSMWWDDIKDYIAKCKPSKQLLKEAAELAAAKLKTRVLL